LTNLIPNVWKSAFIIPLLKEGVPTILNNYRPISKLSVLAKVLEFRVSKRIPGHKFYPIYFPGRISKNIVLPLQP